VPSDPVDDDETEDPDGIDARNARKLRRPALRPEDQARVDAFMARARKPLTPGDPRLHHSIPQLFQKRFADDDERLMVTPLSGGRPKRRHTSKIAVMADLYTSIDVEVGETVAVERILGLADGEAAGAIDRMARGMLFPPSQGDREALAMWIALLYVPTRSPAAQRRRWPTRATSWTWPLAVTPRSLARVCVRTSAASRPTRRWPMSSTSPHNLDDIEFVPRQSTLIKLMLDSALAMFPHLFKRRYTVIRFPEPGLVPVRPAAGAVSVTRAPSGGHGYRRHQRRPTVVAVGPQYRVDPPLRLVRR
jgi:hypothetical protein